MRRHMALMETSVALLMEDSSSKHMGEAVVLVEQELIMVAVAAAEQETLGQ